MRIGTFCDGCFLLYSESAWHREFDAQYAFGYYELCRRLSHVPQKPVLRGGLRGKRYRADNLVDTGGARQYEVYLRRGVLCGIFDERPVRLHKLAKNREAAERKIKNGGLIFQAAEFKCNNNIGKQFVIGV